MTQSNTLLLSSSDRPAPPRLSASSNREHLAFWKTRLVDAPTSLDLPLARARPARIGPEIDRVPVVVPKGTLERLTAIAVSEETDLFSVLLAAWRTLLFRLTDQQDFVVGCTGSPALRQDEDGFLISRASISGRETFCETIRRTRASLRDAIEHAEVSFGSLLFTLQIEPTPGRHPLFHAGFFCRDDIAAEHRGPTPLAYPPCDLALEWSGHGANLNAQLEFPSNLFDRSRVQRLAANLGRLLAGLTEYPDQPIEHAPLLSDDELCDLAAWNATAHQHSREFRLADIFADQVRRTPNAAAVEFAGETLTYAQLDRRTNQLAHTLQARGVTADATVALSVERSFEMIVGVLAILKAGGAYVPLDPAYPTARLAYMIADSGARLLLTQASLVAALPTDKIETVLLDRDWPAITQSPETTPHNPASGESLGYVIYTSGSTGQPKGVAMPQVALTNLVAWQVRQPGFQSGARTSQFSSLSFDVSFQEMFATWASGGTLVLVSESVRRDPVSLLDHLIANRVTRLFLPFVALRGLAEAAVANACFPRDLREIYTAGEQLQVDDVVRRFFTAMPDCLLENQYGPSESHVVTAHTLRGAPEEWPALPSIGRPIANTTIHILDAQKQRRPIGIPGELFIGGLCLARGYLGKADLTSERFISPFGRGSAARLYRTGDLARWMPDGTIQFLGRIDHQVKFRGFRIEPGEIATVLSGFAGVTHCAAAVREIKDVGRRLVAYVVVRDKSVFSLAALHAFARERLPDYMVPSHVVVLDTFPLTPSGKLDTKALPEPSFDREILANTFVAPRSPAELALARIWSRLLGVPQIGVNDDFFELGGDSLMAVELFAAIRREFGRDLSPGELARRPTIAGLAGVITGDSHKLEWTSLVPIQTLGNRTPFFCVHGGAGEVTLYPRIARQLPSEQPFYALQFPFEDGLIRHATVTEMAHHYLREIRTLRPRGPYRLGGACVGALVAYEMARQLLNQNESVELLVMYDAPNVWSPAFDKGDQMPELIAAVRRGPLRKIRLRLIFHRYTRTRAPKEQHGRHQWMTLLNAVWTYRIRRIPVRTLCFVTGTKEAAMLDPHLFNDPGHWNDDARGWSDWESPSFEIHRIHGTKHADVPFAAETGRILSATLRKMDESKTG